MREEIFPLGDVLSIVTGRLLSERHMGGVYEILNHMTGEDLYTHQLVRAAEVCKPALLKQFPELDREWPSLGEESLKDYLNKFKPEYGDQFAVKSLEEGVYESKGALTELAEMMG